MTKLDAIEFSALHERYRQMQLTDARLAVAKAEFDLMVASLFEAHDMIQGKHALCLMCGTFFVRGFDCGCSSVQPAAAADG